MRILMLGNSLTFANDMPRMLAELTGGELYKIEQEQPYSEDYKTCSASCWARISARAAPLHRRSAARRWIC